MTEHFTPPAALALQPGDLVAFRFPYAEGGSPYARPCLVLETTTAEVLLAYGTSSRGRANQGLEIRVNRDFAACGLVRPTRFVTARRVRVARTDPRLEADLQTGSPLIGRLPDALQARRGELCNRLAAAFATPECRYRTERAGIHPPKGRRRGGAGIGIARPAGDQAA